MCVAAEWRQRMGADVRYAGLSGRSVYDVTGYALVDTAASCAEEQGVGSTGLGCIRCRTASTGRPCSSQVSSARWAGSPNGTTRCLLPLPVTLMVRLEKSTSTISIDTSSATRMPVAYSSSRIAALRCDSATTRALSRLSARAGASLRFTVSADLSAVLPTALPLPLPDAAAAPPSPLYWFVATACSATSNNCSA